MKISIITVCYNSALTIHDTFESVLNQTYYDIEYIVIDGNSKDDTVSIIKKYEDKFNGRMKWISEPDNGLYDAMNKGIMISSGEIIGILNSDDIYYDNNVIKDVVYNMEQNSADTLYGNIEFVKYNDLDTIVRKWISSPFLPGSFKKGWHPPHPSFFVKKIIYEQYGMFDISFEVSADFELMLRLLEKYKISTVYFNRKIVKMRLGGESNSSIKKIIIGNIGVLRAFKKNGISISCLYIFYRLFPKLLLYIKK